MQKLIEVICKNSVKERKKEHDERVKKIEAKNRRNREARKRNAKMLKRPLEVVPEDGKVDPFVPPDTQFSWSDGRNEYAKDAARILAIDTKKPAAWYSGDKQADCPRKPVDVERFFPKMQAATVINFQVTELLCAVRFVLTLGKRKNEDHSPVFLSASDDTVTLSSDYEGNSAEIMVEGIPMPFSPCELCLNGKYLKEYLEAVKRGKIENVLFEFFQGGYPIQFSAQGSKYLIMPILIMRD